MKKFEQKLQEGKVLNAFIKLIDEKMCSSKINLCSLGVRGVGPIIHNTTGKGAGLGLGTKIITKILTKKGNFV